MKKLLLFLVAIFVTTGPLTAHAYQVESTAPTSVVASAEQNNVAAAVQLEQLMHDLCLGGLLDFLNQLQNLLDALRAYIDALGNLFNIGIDPPTFNPNCFQNPSINLPDFSSCLLADLNIGNFNCNCQLPNVNFAGSIDACLDQFQINLGGINPADCIGLPDIHIPDLWGQLAGLLDLIQQLLNLDLNLGALATLRLACADGVIVGPRTGGATYRKIKLKKKKICNPPKRKVRRR